MRNKLFILLAISFVQLCFVGEIILFLYIIRNYPPHSNTLLSFFPATLGLLIIVTSLALQPRIMYRLMRKLKKHRRNISFAYTTSILSKQRNRDNSDIADKLGSLVNSNVLHKNDLITILNAIKEGILVLSDKNEIMYYNQSFCDYCKVEGKIRGEKYYKVIKSDTFDSFISTLRRTKQNRISTEMTIHNTLFKLNTSISKNNKIFVIVFHDISEARALEKIKKDFIINASHELRTPLTSIKGYLELLNEEETSNTEYSTRQKYLEIITRNTNRIINIISDLLKLSNLEQTGIQLNIEEHDVNELIKDIVPLFENRLKNKSLDLRLNFGDNTSLAVDKLKIEEVFINLIGNAIKYTEQGYIEITTKSSRDTVTIHIKDTGIGISSKYHSRIFERFFVVDKARSRATEGTGLGLAIVKHIIQLHQGSLELLSNKGVGTEFIITLYRELDNNNSRK